jgi:hypothetical protein
LIVLIITQILGGNLGKSNVGFRNLNPTYKIGDPTTRSAIALLCTECGLDAIPGSKPAIFLQ